MKHLLKEKGIIVGSTPWIIPIHDRPFDYYRYTHFFLLNTFEKLSFEVVDFYARGGWTDALIGFLFRGLKSGGRIGKAFSIIALLIARFRPLPKPQKHLPDACLGYSWVIKARSE